MSDIPLPQKKATGSSNIVQPHLPHCIRATCYIAESNDSALSSSADPKMRTQNLKGQRMDCKTDLDTAAMAGRFECWVGGFTTALLVQQPCQASCALMDCCLLRRSMHCRSMRVSWLCCRTMPSSAPSGHLMWRWFMKVGYRRAPAGPAQSRSPNLTSQLPSFSLKSNPDESLKS